MVRPLRIEYEGAWYHVMNRGASRQSVFNSDEQRQYFLSLLADTAGRFNAEWHAYCLMDNHYHLLVRTPDGNLQRIMRHINGLYTQYFNRTQGRDGALFRGRYKAILVDAQSYWERLSRYVHRNPIEAGLIDNLEDYPWSSYPAYIGREAKPSWLTCDYILHSLADRGSEDYYRHYIESGVDEEIATFFAGHRQSPVLGDDGFKRRLRVPMPTVDLPDLKPVSIRPTAEQIVKSCARHFEVDEHSIWTSRRDRRSGNPARAMAMYLCQIEGDMRLAAIADHFGLRHYASAGASIRQFRERLRDNAELGNILNSIKLDLTP